MRNRPGSKSSSKLSLSTLLKLERLVERKVENLELIEQVKILSNLDGFTAELTLRYIQAIKQDRANDILGLLD